MENCDGCDTETNKLGPDGATGILSEPNISVDNVAPSSITTTSSNSKAASSTSPAHDATTAAASNLSGGEETSNIQPAKFLQLMAQWLDGAGDPSNEINKESLYRCWNGRYDEDCEEEALVVPDLAPVLGLPLGTTPAEISRIAAEQEEDLIKQLIT